MEIGYQGTLGSFSQIAAERIFNNCVYKNYYTFKEVIAAVINEEIDFGVLPLENSYTGEVSMVLDELYLNDVYISMVFNLPIKQNLIGLKESKIEDIKTVYSHEQALLQCSEFLRERKYELVSFANTALASEYIKNQNDITKASIASNLTAELYGLKVLKEEINNNKKNTTRFAVISKKLINIKNHFAFIFTVKDERGALANILNEISYHGVNLTAISSHSIHEEWKYYFYCEAEGRIDGDNIKKMCSILKEKCATFKIIGSY